MNSSPASTRYNCLGLNSQGATEQVLIAAKSEADAARHMTAQGLTPIHISTEGPSLVEAFKVRLQQPVQFQGRLNSVDLTGLTERLALLLKAGLTLSQALELEAKSVGRASVLALAQRLDARIKAGESLGRAFADERRVPPYYVGVIAAAEQSGRLAQGLAELASSSKLADQTRAQLVTTLSYPLFVLVSTFVALVFVLTIVIPNFETLFEGETARLPTLTRVVLGLSHLVNHYGPWLLAGIALFGCAIWYSLRTAWFMRWWQRRLSSRSGLFDLIRTVQAGRALRILGTQISNGVAIAEALDAAHRALSGGYGELMRESSKAVREGQSLSQLFRVSPLMPPAATKLIEVGEAGGTMGPMMLEAARLFEASAAMRLERLVAIANPLAIMLLGGLVATLIGSVMVGIFSIEGTVLH